MTSRNRHLKAIKLARDAVQSFRAVDSVLDAPKVKHRATLSTGTAPALLCGQNGPLTDLARMYSADEAMCQLTTTSGVIIRIIAIDCVGSTHMQYVEDLAIFVPRILDRAVFVCEIVKNLLNG